MLRIIQVYAIGDFMSRTNGQQVNMNKAFVFGKSAAFGILFIFLGIAILAAAMYVYVPLVNGAYKHALAIGMTWDPIGLLRYWGLSTASIQWIGLGGPIALFMIGFVWKYRRSTTVDVRR